MSCFSPKTVVCVLALGLPLLTAAQGTSGAPGGGARPSLPPNPILEQRLDFISGRIVMADGTPPSAPVAIERICNGSVRREGYSDGHGYFQFQFGRDSNLMQDASEDSIVSRMTTQRESDQARRTGGRRIFVDCEVRAVLAGFQSSSLPLTLEPNSQRQEIGTLILTRLADIKGSTVSTTTLLAPDEARHAYEKAQKNLADEKYPEAEKNLAGAIQKYPQFAAAWFDLGMVHEKQGDVAQAKADYQRAQRADPKFVNPYFGLGMIAVRQKNWPEAALLTAQVAEMDSGAFPAAYFYNAVANYNLGNLEASEKSVRTFLAMDSSRRHPESTLLLAEILEQRHDYAGAAEQKRNYLKIAPNAANAETVRASLKRLEDLSAASHN